MSQVSKIIETVDVKCPKCGNPQSYKKILLINNSEFGECTKCGTLTYSKMPTQKTYNSTPIVKCPYCNSTNTKKISEMSKAASVAVFGVFAMGKVSKQWHCNNCKSDF